MTLEVPTRILHQLKRVQDGGRWLLLPVGLLGSDLRCYCVIIMLESGVYLTLELHHLLGYVLLYSLKLIQLLLVLNVSMVNAVNNLLLLQLLRPVHLQKLSLHELVLQQLHAVLLIEID